MRLLQHSETGEFNLTEDLVGDDPIPPYAILSHTWGLDTEEVTFKDMTNGTGEVKHGYEKIRFCGEQARKMVCNTFGLTPAVSTRKIMPNSHALSTPCFAGTATRFDATSIYRMSLALTSTSTMSAMRGHGNRISGRADGSLGAGRFKSYSPQLRSSSSPRNASDLVTRAL